MAGSFCDPSARVDAVRIIKRLCLAAMVCALFAAFTPSVSAVVCDGTALDDGCLFTVTGGDTPDPDDGFAVTNAYDVPLWDFVKARDLDALGYPISQRWTDGPFTLQAFQKVILQWDPARRRMNYFNSLDALANRYPEVELPFVPGHQVLEADRGMAFGTVTRNHLALLDQNPAIQQRFLAEPDWLNLYGLPIRYEEREVEGNPQGVQLLRTQRTVFAIWNVPAPGTTIGRVLLQNLPDQLKKLSNVVIPNRAKNPVTEVHPETAPNMAAAIGSLPWTSDGLTEWEQEALDSLARIGASWPTVGDVLLEKPWLVDGITRSEARFLTELNSLILIIESIPPEPGVSTTIEDVLELIEEILSMPFVDTIEDYDAHAIYELYKKHVSPTFDQLPPAYPEFELTFQGFQRTVSHLASGGGMTDDQALIIANRIVESAYYIDNEKELRLHLDPDLSVKRDISIERRKIKLPLSGDMLLIVVRSEPSTISTMDVLEESVRVVEHIMGEPFVVDHVALFIEQRRGFRFGSWDRYYMTISPRLLRDEKVLRDTGFGIVVHETAHYYWQRGTLWLVEGAADFVAELSGKDNKSRIAATEAFCEFEFIADIFENPYFDRSCNYYLGARLFSELHAGLGSRLFHEGFKRLYAIQKENKHIDGVVPRIATDGQVNIKPGIDYVLRAFVSEASSEAAAIAEAIIMHRYYGGDR